MHTSAIVEPLRGPDECASTFETIVRQCEDPTNASAVAAAKKKKKKKKKKGKGGGSELACLQEYPCFKIVSTEKLGRHAIASKDLEPGEVVLVERPYAFVIFDRLKVTAWCAPSTG